MTHRPLDFEYGGYHYESMQDQTKWRDLVRSSLKRAGDTFDRLTVLTERTAWISLLLCTSLLAGSCLTVSALSINVRREMTVSDSTENIRAAAETTQTAAPSGRSEGMTEETYVTLSKEDLERQMIADVIMKGNLNTLESAGEEDDEEVSAEVIRNTAPKNLSDRQVTRMLNGGAGQVRIIDRKDINEGAASSGSSEDTGNAQAESSAVSGNSGVATSATSNNNYVIGIDVSSWNGNINWQKVKDYGVRFVMIKCGGRYWGSGLLYKDKQFDANIKGARAAGLDVGVYFYSAATTVKEAYEEASYVVSLIKDYTITYPVAIDFEINSQEYRHAGVKGKELRDILCTFCDTVKSQGYKPMVYMSKSCWTSVLGSTYASEVSSKYKVWLALYYNRFIDGAEPFKIGDNLPSFGYGYDIWQYGYLKGVVPGVSGSVDMNLSFMSKTSLTTPAITVPGNGKISAVKGSSTDPASLVSAVNSLGRKVESPAIKVTVRDSQDNIVTANKALSETGTYKVTYSFTDPYYGIITASATLSVTDQSAASPSTAAATATAAPATVTATAPSSESAPSESTETQAPSTQTPAPSENSDVTEPVL